MWICCTLNGKAEKYDFKKIIKMIKNSISDKRERIHSSIRQTYDSLYQKVDHEFYPIGKFGIELAIKNRWYFKDKNFQYGKKS